MCSLFYWYIGAQYTHTWFDPMRIAMITNVFMATAFVFLYLAGSIDTNIFLYFVLAEIIFWIGFKLGFKPNTKVAQKKTLIGEKKIAFCLFWIFLFLYIVCTLLVYSLLGIPIFQESRLDTFTGSGGLGLIGRMIPFFKIYCIFYIYYLLNKRPSFSIKMIAYISLAIFLVTGILTGSRSSFIIFITVFWGYSYFYRQNISSFKKYYKYFGVFLIVTLFTFGFQSGDLGLMNSFSLFSARMILSGDNYMMALPNDIWKQVFTNGWFTDFFYGLLGPARIMSGEGIQPPIGYQLTWILYPKLYGLSSGPLSSPSLLGLVYFGWGGLAFVFIIGSFTGFMFYLINHVLPKGVISSIVKIYLTINLITFIFDPRLAMGYLFDSIVNILFLCILILITYSLLTHKINQLSE